MAMTIRQFQRIAIEESDSTKLLIARARVLVSGAKVRVETETPRDTLNPYVDHEMVQCALSVAHCLIASQFYHFTEVYVSEYIFGGGKYEVVIL